MSLKGAVIALDVPFLKRILQAFWPYVLLALSLAGFVYKFLSGTNRLSANPTSWDLCHQPTTAAV